MPITPEQRASLQAIRQILLDLHKLLLDRDRGLYERQHGSIASPGEFLSLVLNHDQFEWLRQMSGAIVQIDELVSPRSKSSPDEAASVLETLRGLLTLNEEGNDFQRRYWQAIQDSPDVVIAHCKAEKLLRFPTEP